MLLHTNARLCTSARLRFNQPMLCRRWQLTRAASANGKQPEQQRVEDDAHDPVAAMLWAAQQQDGVRVVFQEEGDLEELADLEDVLEDLEDPWMRNPSPPAWSEAPLFGVPDVPSSSSSSSDGAAAPGTTYASDPGSGFATVSWQQLQQQMQEKQQQQLVVLEVKCPDDHQQQQQQQQPCRPLPDPLQWPRRSGEAVERVTVESLAGLTRELAAGWKQGAVVAVWDSGHHSCLAAAIRLSAVYRLPHVVLLQQDS